MQRQQWQASAQGHPGAPGPGPSGQSPAEPLPPVTPRRPVPAAAPPQPRSLDDRSGALRAMENPISATFDLAESVNDRVPRIKKMVKYASLFIGFSLLIEFILILVFLAGNILLFLVFLAFFIVGLFSLYWMRQVGAFFDYFSSRHVAIKMMREGDPVVHVPRGKDSLDRLLNHFKLASPAFDNLLRQNPRALTAPSIMKGASRVDYSFDAYVTVPQAWPGGMLGLGNPGYALYIKILPAIPEMKDVRAVENAVTDVVRVTGVAPGRVVILAENREGREPLLPQDVYDHVTTSRFVIPAGRQSFVCNLQVITVDTDGTYDFVPMISTLPEALP